jgi:hypothetical protein
MTPEFSHPLVLANVPAEGLTLRLEADAAARARLAERMGLLALHALTAELRLRPEPEGCIGVRGRMRAEVEQACVVTLDPVAQSVDEEVAWRLLPAGMEPTDGDDDPDDIETEDGVADLGEALAQQLSLALDPYPRAPGAELPAEYGPDAASGPFAALAGLQRPS